MEILELPIKRIRPYEKNPRRNDGAVDAVAASIAAFGFKVPIVIDTDNVIVTGHTRWKAAKRLGMDTVPCIRAEDLNDEQIKAFRLADNKTAELAEWDFDLLDEEIADILTFDMEDFGFEFEDKHDAWKAETQDREGSMLNMERGVFEGEGKYDIPKLLPIKNIPPIKQWIGFNEILSDKNPEGKGVHFFISDYQFERLWNNPDKYVPLLKCYTAVATPDFSPYSDMPQALQIYNHYRKHWIGAFLQANGVTIIPTIRASADTRSLEWWLDGEPSGGEIIISTMWSGNEVTDTDKSIFDEMYARLKPSKIYVYGKITKEIYGNIERIESFTEKWRKTDGDS